MVPSVFDEDEPSSIITQLPRPDLEEAEKAFQELRAGLPRYTDTGEPYPLLDQPQLWELLRIPFSVAVAAAAAIKVEKPGEDEEPSQISPGEEMIAADELVLGLSPERVHEMMELLAKRKARRESGVIAEMPRSLRSAIARELNKPVEKLRTEDLPNVTTLDLSNTEIKDLSPLAGMTGLLKLDLEGTQVSDLSPLAGMTGLKLLDFEGTQVSDLSPLAGMTELQGLYLRDTPVSDLSPLAGMTALQELWLNRTPVSDLSPLAGMTQLQVLVVDEGADTGPLDHIEGLIIHRE